MAPTSETHSSKHLWEQDLYRKVLNLSGNGMDFGLGTAGCTGAVDSVREALSEKENLIFWGSRHLPERHDARLPGSNLT